MVVRILEGDALTMLRGLESESVQCVVTSPPYFQLRDYGMDGQIGMEATPAAFIAALLDVFDEVRRVLRPDGLCFVNLGDSYSGSGNGGAAHDGSSIVTGLHSYGMPPTKVNGVKPKNLLLIPERFAIGMQERGWIVRSRIAWCKTSAMPESVRDRPTSAWEHLWMFSKSRAYYYDADAVRQPATCTSRPETSKASGQTKAHIGGTQYGGTQTSNLGFNRPETGANLRNYWLLSPEPSRLEHFAGFPTELPKRCILAGTSERGCCSACGAPWVRVVERGTPDRDWQRRSGADRNGEYHGRATKDYDSAVPNRPPGFKDPSAVKARILAGLGASRATGWAPSCSHDAGPPIPQTVLDPFLGSGTTALVADRLGRDAIGIELNPTYARMARDRIDNDAPMVSEPVEVVDGDQLGLFEVPA